MSLNITILGSGYVGLVTGVGLAAKGHNICLFDTDADKVAALSRAEVPFYEEGLEPLLQRSIGSNLRVTAHPQEAVADADIIFLCVPTYCQYNGAIDLNHCMEAISTISEVFQSRGGYPLVVVKSTVVPGTTEEVLLPWLERTSGKKAGEHFGVLVNPEFLREGRAITDFFKPDRIVIGELTSRDGDVLSELYQGFEAPIMRFDMRTAEMIKYTSNAFLATKISFINEIGNICKKKGVDVYDVARGVCLDSRISPHFFNAGIGFGGSCLPKDTKALVAYAKELGYEAALLQSVLKVNDAQPLRLVELAVSCEGSLDGKSVAVLGLAFKPETEDIREAPSIKIIDELLLRGSKVTAYDPMATGNIKKLFGERIGYADSAATAISKAGIVFVITEWEEFKDPKLYREKKVFNGRKVINNATTDCTRYEGICW